VTRIRGPVIVLLLGGLVAELTLSGQFENYVRPTHRPWLLAVAAALLVLGVVGLVVALRDGETAEPAASRSARLHTHGPLAVSREEIAAARRAEAGHDHHRVPGVAWLVCLPVLLALVVPPQALGAFAAARAGGSVPAPASSVGFAPLPSSPGPVALEVHDYAERAAWDDGRTVVGRPVTLTGFVTPDPDGGWSVTRAVLTCCAADARSYLVHVAGDPTPRAADSWVRVTGTFVPSTDGVAHSAAIAATEVHAVAQPDEPYEE
jgi:uncharacterized repeat protein (TIGR03943 family)